MFSDHLVILNYLPLLLAAVFKFYAWPSSRYVSWPDCYNFCLTNSMNLKRSSLRLFGYVVPGLSRSTDDCGDFSLRLHGSDCWLSVWKVVQDDEGQRMEKGFILCEFEKKSLHVVTNLSLCLTGCNVLPRSHFLDVLLPQFFHLGQTQQRSRTIYYHVVSALSLVLHLFPTRISGLLFWIPQSSIWAPCPHQSDPSTDTRASVVHEPRSLVSWF